MPSDKKGAGKGLTSANKAGDCLIPKNEGAITENHILGELGEILLNQKSGRESQKEITLYKCLGLAVEDIAAAYYVYEQAIELNLGTFVEL